jgi:hypothetical protein
MNTVMVVVHTCAWGIRSKMVDIVTAAEHVRCCPVVAAVAAVEDTRSREPPPGNSQTAEEDHCHRGDCSHLVV